SSKICHQLWHYGVEGWGVYQLLARNYVGSGSNAVFRRSAIEAVGLFERSLSGSEDFLLTCLVAWEAPVTNVSECLVAYRDTPNSMSKDQLKMVAASAMVVVILHRRLPGITPAGRRSHKAWVDLRMAAARYRAG